MECLRKLGMELVDRQVLVTGGAGFVGSHLVEKLVNHGNYVSVIDNLSNGKRERLPKDVEFVRNDLTQKEVLDSVITPEIDVIFHFAARKETNDSDPLAQFRENTAMTHNLLAAAEEVGVDNFVYTSSSTVYGEAPRPTPEDYAPLEPISVYGASKLADEGLLSTYAHSHNMRVWNFRFANVVGSRLRGAVVPDFIEKLQADPTHLEILGNGRQEKSYLHVTDCIRAMEHVIESTGERAEKGMCTYNLGTRTTTSVDTIADIVCDVMNVSPEFEYTGGNRGWTGDVPKMRLSIEKLRALGWEPELESTAAVRRAAEELAEEL